MSDIVVYTPTENKSVNLIEAAKKGLFSELTDLSILMYEQAIDSFLEYLQNADHSEFGGSLSVAFAAYLKSLSDKGYKPSTVNAKRAQLRRFMEWGATVGWIDQQTLVEIKQIKAPKALGGKHGNWITFEQMQQMLNDIDVSTVTGRRDKALLAMLFGTGIRRSEVVKLTWGHLQRIGNSWAIVNLDRKHHRTQALIAVPEFVMKAIEQYSPRGADNQRVFVSYTRWGQTREKLTGETIRKVVQHYGKELGVGTFNPHDARRSFARAAKKNGLPLSQLSMTLGHSSVGITEKYVNELYELEQAANAVELEI